MRVAIALLFSLFIGSGYSQNKVIQLGATASDCRGALMLNDTIVGPVFSPKGYGEKLEIQGYELGDRSRIPWQSRVDLQIDKSWIVNLGTKGDVKKTGSLNVYLLVNNLLNMQNILSVYRYTGNPDDDGYLTSPQFTPSIESQIDPESFRQFYALKVANPQNYTMPRTIQLGVRFDF